MKKSLLTTVMVAIACFAFGQSAKEEVDLMQAAFGREKKALAAEFIIVEGEGKDAFWSLYDEYETKRKDLGKKRLELLDKYVSTYGNLDDDSMEKLVKEMMTLQDKNDDLISNYYNKLKKASGIKPAAQFYQFENYVLSKVRILLMENIPLIGEFEKK